MAWHDSADNSQGDSKTGQILCLYSEKGPGFVSTLFRHINDLLGIKQVSSGSRTARSNSLAEAAMKQLVEHLKI